MAGGGRLARIAEEGKTEQGSWGVLDGVVTTAVAPGGRRWCLLVDGTSGRWCGAVEMAGEWCHVPGEQRRSRGDRTKGCSQKNGVSVGARCGWPDMVAGEGWRRPGGRLLVEHSKWRRRRYLVEEGE